MANKQKTVYVCSDCGAETPNWAGKCPSCGAWNTLSELRMEKSGAGRISASRNAPTPKRLEELDVTEEIRFSTGISEFDRVLGGGAVLGSLVLVGGAPGIGKSTLLLQMCAAAGKSRKILYVTGEESERQKENRYKEFIELIKSLGLDDKNPPLDMATLSNITQEIYRFPFTKWEVKIPKDASTRWLSSFSRMCQLGNELKTILIKKGF